MESYHSPNDIQSARDDYMFSALAKVVFAVPALAVAAYALHKNLPLSALGASVTGIYAISKAAGDAAQISDLGVLYRSALAQQTEQQEPVAVKQ